MNIKPIKTKQDYKAALKRIEVLWDAKPSTLKGDELDILATLVCAYEEAHYPIDNPDPIEAIRFRMDQMGLDLADMTQFIGARSKVSEVFNRKRPLSLRMIRNVSQGLQIPADVLVREYPLNGQA